MSYILKNIPAYETANEQINQVSKKWQSEVEALQKEAETMYKNYQTELVFMSEDMKKKREEEIVAKEKEAQLKRKYFGPEGELIKKRESLMKPIQDEVYTAIQSISKERNLELVFDKSTAMSVIFTTPGIDISDEVLKQLGYSK
jgi:outer membrane protein